MDSMESSVYGSILAERARPPETSENRQWYLARYITGGKNRENLFAWLENNHAFPWTPLTTIRKKRADYGYRTTVSPVFPGYFFLKNDFEALSIEAIRRHSVFLDFVTFGHQISPVNESLIEALLETWPAPTSEVGLQFEKTHSRLTREQFSRLALIHETSAPVSRIALLMQLLSTDSLLKT